MYKTCKICGKKRANKQHVETHNILYDDYLKEYEPEKYKLNKDLKAIKDLYITVRYKWAEMSVNGAYRTYRNSEYNTQGIGRKYSLVDSDIRQHLNCDKTLAVYSPSKSSKVMIFDIDEKNTDTLENIYNALCCYLPKESISCFNSGNKGYHITVYFKELLSHNIIREFYKLVMLDSKSPAKVELLGADNRPFKLPLSINFKNKDHNSNYCFTINEYGAEIKKDIADIKQSDPEHIYNALEIAKEINPFSDKEIMELEELTALNMHVKNYDTKSKVKTVKKYIKQGIQEKGTRHKITLEIAIYNKEYLNMSEEENKRYLLNWTAKQDNYSSSDVEVYKDIKYMINTVYSRDYKFYVKSKDITLTVPELKEILSIKRKAVRKLYFKMFVHSKAWSDKNGIFYMTYKQMNSSPNRGHLKALIDDLNKDNKIEVIRSGVKHKPNKYRITALNKDNNQQVKVFSICDMNCSDCMEKACIYLLSDEELKERFNNKQIRNLKKLDKCEYNL